MTEASTPARGKIYLLHGDDAFAQADARQKLEAKVLDPAWRDFNLTALGPDAPARKIVEAVLAMPFGAGLRLVVVKEPAFLLPRAAGAKDDPSAAEFEKLLDTGLPPSSALLLMASKLDGRLKLVKKLLETAVTREFARPKPWQVEEQLTPWVTQIANERQRRIQPDAISALLAATSGDRYRIQREIEKLSTYAHEGAAITASDVKALVAGGEIEVFALTEAIARRQAGAALVALDRLLVSEHALKMLAAVATILRGWWRLLLLAESGKPTGEIARELGARSDFKVRKDLELLRGWRAAGLERALGLLLEVDLAIKAGQWAPDLHPVLLAKTIGQILAPPAADKPTIR